MEKKTMEERYASDTLTNNTALNKYQQCENCALRDDGTVYSNHYQKGCCAMYPYPTFKPREVMLNKGTCKYRREKKG